MQDRYAGDLGDYSKLGLIRALGAAPLRIGLVWCLADDESHNADGKHIRYLHDDRLGLAGCDPALHAVLKRMIDQSESSQGERSVAALEALNVWPRGMRFFTERLSYAGVPLGERAAMREAWLGRAVEATRGCDVVFFDPDNGLEISSVSRRAIKAPKYIRFDELTPFWRRGQSLVIYQHLTRQGTAEAQAARRCGQLRQHLGVERVTALRFNRGTARLYLHAMQPQHQRRIARCHDELLARWSPHFQAV